MGLLDSDVLVMLADIPADRAVVDGDALLLTLPAVRAGRMIILDTDTRAAMTSNTVLSIPYAVEHLAPALAGALSR